MLSIVENEKVDYLFNLGDTFETQDAVKTKFHNTFYQFCKRVNIPHYIIVGNHDCPQKHNTKINAMTPFGEIDNTFVIDELTFADLKGIRFHLQPYVEEIDKETLANNHSTNHDNILLAHVAIEGAKMNAVRKCSKGVDIRFDAFRGCFFGHFHTRQQIADNAWYIGSLTQQNWSLANCPTGFAIYDLDADILKFHDLGSIQHKLIDDAESLSEDNIKGHCIKLKMNEKFSPALRDRIVSDLKDKGALDVKIDFGNQVTVEDGRIEKLEDHINSTEHYMQSIIEDSGTEQDRDYLLEVGLECLQQAEDIHA